MTAIRASTIVEADLQVGLRRRENVQVPEAEGGE